MSDDMDIPAAPPESPQELPPEVQQAVMGAQQAQFLDGLADAYNAAAPRERKTLDGLLLVAQAKNVSSARGLLRLLPWIAVRKPLKAK